MWKCAKWRIICSFDDDLVFFKATAVRMRCIWNSWDLVQEMSISFLRIFLASRKLWFNSATNLCSRKILLFCDQLSIHAFNIDEHDTLMMKFKVSTREIRSFDIMQHFQIFYTKAKVSAHSISCHNTSFIQT